MECVFLNHTAAPLTNQTTMSGLLEKILEPSLRNLIGIFKINLNYHRSLYLTQNVYAFTLEFAMPSMFPKLPPQFTSGIGEFEKMRKYKMQELASAYYKVFKYNKDYFREMTNGAIKEIKDEETKTELIGWLAKFANMNEQKKLRQTKEQSLAEFRSAHNEKYQEYLQSMSQGNTGGYQIKSIGN